MNLTLDETLHTIIGSYLLNPFPFLYNSCLFTIHIAIGIVVLVAPRHDTYRIIHVQLFQQKLKILQFILMCINFLMVLLQNNFHRSQPLELIKFVCQGNTVAPDVTDFWNPKGSFLIRHTVPVIVIRIGYSRRQHSHFKPFKDWFSSLKNLIFLYYIISHTLCTPALALNEENA